MCVCIVCVCVVYMHVHVCVSERERQSNHYIRKEKLTIEMQNRAIEEKGHG